MVTNARNVLTRIVLFLCFISTIRGFIVKPQFEILPDLPQKRNGNERIDNILQAILRSQGQDRMRRGPLWPDFGVNSRWKAGSDAANILRAYSQLNDSNGPGKRR